MNKRPLKINAQVGYLFVFAIFRHWDMPPNTLSQTTVVVVPVRRSSQRLRHNHWYTTMREWVSRWEHRTAVKLQ